MTITERSRERVRRLEARLAETDEFSVHEETWSISRSDYAKLRDRFEADAHGGAGAWIIDGDGAVLLVRNEGDDGWTDPGGKRKVGESFAETARREVREEAGVECRLRGVRELYAIEHRPPAEAPILSPIVIFDAGYVSGEPRPRAGEIAEVGWFTDAPERVRYEQVRTRPYPTSESVRD